MIKAKSIDVVVHAKETNKETKCASPGCTCVKFVPNIWVRTKCKHCMHTLAIHEGAVSTEEPDKKKLEPRRQSVPDISIATPKETIQVLPRQSTAPSVLPSLPRPRRTSTTPLHLVERQRKSFSIRNSRDKADLIAMLEQEKDTLTEEEMSLFRRRLTEADAEEQNVEHHNRPKSSSVPVPVKDSNMIQLSPKRVNFYSYKFKVTIYSSLQRNERKIQRR